MKYFPLTLLLLSTFFVISATGQSTPRPNTKALELMTAGDFRGAIGILDTDIRQNKNLFDSFKLRSDLKRMIGDFQGSLDDLDKAIEIDSSQGALYERRATIRMILRQDLNQTLSDLDSAISYGVKNEKVFATRGMIHSYNGDIDKSIADYETAIGLRPDFAQAHLGLSSAYQRKNDLGKAALVLENFIATLENSNSRISPVKGKITATSSVLLPQGSDKSIVTGQDSIIVVGESRPGGPPSPEQMEKMNDRLEQSKNRALAYINLASLYEMRNEYEKAMSTVEKAIQLDPTDYAGFATRARIKLGLKDHVGALADLDGAIRTMPTFAPAYLNRGIAYLMLGRETEAQKDFDKYLQLFPNGKSVLEKRVAEVKAKIRP